MDFDNIILFDGKVCSAETLVKNYLLPFKGIELAYRDNVLVTKINESEMRIVFKKQNSYSSIAFLEAYSNQLLGRKTTIMLVPKHLASDGELYSLIVCTMLTGFVGYYDQHNFI